MTRPPFSARAPSNMLPKWPRWNLDEDAPLTEERDFTRDETFDAGGPCVQTRGEGITEVGAWRTTCRRRAHAAGRSGMRRRRRRTRPRAFAGRRSSRPRAWLPPTLPRRRRLENDRPRTRKGLYRCPRSAV